MMAAELNSFPLEIREELNLFFDANTAWLEHVLDQGKKSGEFTFSNEALERSTNAYCICSRCTVII